MGNLNLGLGLTIVGIGTVFLVLFLLQITMNLETLFLKKLLQPKKTEQDFEPVSEQHNQINNVLPASSTKPEKTEQVVSREVLAAIVAAISCHTGRPAQSFRVVSVRREWDRNASTSWNLHGYTDLINTRSSFYAKGGSQLNDKKV